MSEPRRRGTCATRDTHARSVQQTGQASRDRVTLRRLCRAAPCTRFQHLCHTPRNVALQAPAVCLLYCLSLISRVRSSGGSRGSNTFATRRTSRGSSPSVCAGFRSCATWLSCTCEHCPLPTGQSPAHHAAPRANRSTRSTFRSRLWRRGRRGARCAEHVSIHPDLVKMWRSPLPPRPRRAA